MNFRFFLPGIIWTGVVILFYSGSYNADCSLWFDCIKGYAFLNVLSFLGFVHIWSVAFKKQTNSDFLKKNGVVVALISGFIFSLMLELIFASQIGLENFDFVRIIMNVLGLLLGLFSFKTLYHRC